MQLLLIRHAIAEDRDAFAQTGAPDEERPITKHGKQRMLRNVRGIKRVVPRVDFLATSPLRRAVQTARIVAEAYGIERLRETDVLRPEKALPEFTRWLARHAAHDVVAVVGHEPHLGTLATWLISGVAEPRIALRKGGIVLLEFDRRATAGGATLQAAVAPAQLRRLGD